MNPNLCPSRNRRKGTHCIDVICHRGIHQDVNGFQWPNRGKRKPAEGVCGAIPQGGDGSAVCVLRPFHKAAHQDQMGARFVIRDRRKPLVVVATGGPSGPAPTHGFLLKRTEWKELRRRIERVCESPGCDPVPDKPDWPPGTVGANIQKLRRLVKQLDARFSAKP